jgi:hypothetical protein
MIDLTQFATGGATRPDSFSGMNPEFNSALSQLIASAPPEIQRSLMVSSGYRSAERQAQLWADALKKYGSPDAARKWVAPPGNSQHNHGNAADLKYASPEALQWVRANAGKFGLAFPLSNENWHIELATARGGQAAPTQTAMTGGTGTPTLAGGAGADTAADPTADPSFDPLASLRTQAPVATVEQSYDPLAALRGQAPAAQTNIVEQARANMANPSPELAAKLANQDAMTHQSIAAIGDLGAMPSVLHGATQGLTFGWGDEAAAKIASGVSSMTGNPISYDAALKSAQGMAQGAEAAHPYLYTGAKVAGNIAGMIPAAAMAPEIAATAPAARIGIGMGMGVAGGGIQGAIQGAGEAKPGERMAGAGAGAALGAALGGTLGAVAPMISAGLRSMMVRLKGRDVATISKAFGISRPAAEAVKNALAADDFTAAANAMGKAGPEAMLADAGPATGQLLDTAAQSGGAANRVVQDAVNTRAEGAYGRLTTTMDTVMGSPEGVQGLALKVAQRTAKQRQSAYDAAYSSPIDYAAPTGQAIEEVVAHVPKDVLAAALKIANDQMQMARQTNMQIMASIAPDGAVTFTKPMNVQQLDMLKRGLDKIARDPLNPLSSNARIMAKQLRTAVADAVPGYDAALKLGGDKLAEKDAQEMGEGILNPSLTREEVKLSLGENPSKEALLAAARGARAAIDDALANVRASLANPSTDIKEAQKLVGDLSTRAAREKLTLILGNQAPKVFEALDRAAKQLYLRGVVARGSQTAGRIATKEGIAASLNSSPTESILRGEPVNASKRVIQYLTNRTPEANIARERAVYDEIANALTAIKGPQADAALKLIEKAANGQPLTDAQARMVARIATTGLGLSLQSAGQATAKQSGLR